jgi:hypothetical protein
MDRIDRIITEAINNQVNIRNVKGYRDGIARVANAISSNQQWMQNQLIADMQDWGMSIVNVYDKGNTGQTNTGNTNMGGNRTYYNNYNHNYGNGFGTSMVNGLLNDLGRAGYGELTDRIQGAVYDFQNGYRKGREQFNRWFGGNEQNQNPQNKQQQNRTQQSSGKYSKYTLMQLLGLRQQMRNNLTTQGNMIPGNASRLLSNMIRYADGMYSVLTGQLNQQSAGQMQAAGTTQGTNVTP